MPTTLFCLGTDVAYTPEDNYLSSEVGKDIKLQETLSTVAGYIEAAADQKPQVIFDADSSKHPSELHFLHNQAVVLDGPDTLGIKVHDRIAVGMIVLINAILQGEDNFNILGFSRGSVQVVHIMQELQRIKNAIEIQPQAELTSEFICTTICSGYESWSNNHLNDYYSARLQQVLSNPDHLSQVISAFKSNATRYNVFLLDPVPGIVDGARYNLFAWSAARTGDRHFILPSLVNHAEVMYAEDEFSPDFIPIWLTPAAPTTTINYSHLPGFHGTASGNPLGHDAQGALAKQFDYTKTRDVQVITFYAMLQFLEKHHVSLIPPTGHERFLETCYQRYVSSKQNASELDKLLYGHYEQILKNRLTYRDCRKTIYKVPGSSFLSMEGERVVFGKISGVSAKRPLTAYVNFDLQKLPFVNTEHFDLAFKTMLLPDDLPPMQASHMQLVAKVDHFMRQFAVHDPETALNKLVLNTHLDAKNNISRVIESAPARLAQYFFAVAMEQEERDALHRVMSQLLQCNLEPASIDEPASQALIASKKPFLAALQKNMVRAIEAEVSGLLNKKKVFIRTIMRQIDLDKESPAFGESKSDSRQEALAIVMKEASSIYDALQYFQDRLQALMLGQASNTSFTLLSFELGEAIQTFGLRTADLLDGLSFPFPQAARQTPFELEVTRHRESKLGEQAPSIVRLKSEIDQLRKFLQSQQDNYLVISDLQQQTNNQECARLQDIILNKNSKIQQYQSVISAMKGNTPSCLEGLSFQLLSGCIIAVGALTVALAVTCLALGLGQVLVPVAMALMGSSIATVGLFSFRKGVQMERDQHNANLFNTV